jgi:Arc/MetJ-type ribon-helix-helix transcriptional regulator
MRTTRVYSITMPPDLARQAERLAKKENRTMSELMREALRRYQQPPVTVDLRELVRMFGPAPTALRSIRRDAATKGSDKLTLEQINREVRAVRKQQTRSRRNAREG